MKRQIPIIIFILLAGFIVKGQGDSIPNHSFETWIDYTSPDYSDPEFWYSPNNFTVPVFGVATVEKDTNGVDGNNCAKLTSKIIHTPFGTRNIPGTLSLAEVDIVDFTFSGGIPFNARPKYFKGYYKYIPVNADTCKIEAFLFKFIARGKHLPVGGGIFMSDSLVNSWTAFTVEIEYLYPDTIDSLNIVIQSSIDTGNVQIGSQLWVDDLQFTDVSGIPIDIFPILKVIAYPNPAKDLVNFELDEAIENAELTIYNSMGSAVLNKVCYGKNISVNTSTFVSGNYYFHLMFGNQKISSGTFIIAK